MHKPFVYDVLFTLVFVASNSFLRLTMMMFTAGSTRQLRSELIAGICADFNSAICKKGTHIKHAQLIFILIYRGESVACQ